MPIETIGLAALEPHGILQEFRFHRRDLGEHDIHVCIIACGMCHSDVHLLRGEWNVISRFPLVPGHEIIGSVVNIGQFVTRFKIGDRVGISVFCDSHCNSCPQCLKGQTQYCQKSVLTYSDLMPDGSISQGGYSKDIVVKENFAALVPLNLDPYKSAPLLCAGITIWSPMKHFKMDQPGKRIGVGGLGGLGHMAILFGLAFGNIVVTISRSAKKHLESIPLLGETFFIDSTDFTQIESSKETLDFIIDTASSKTDTEMLLTLLKPDGVLLAVGIPPAGVVLKISPTSLVWKRKRVAGSFVGSIGDIEEMFKFCSARNLTAVIEKVPFWEANYAIERLSRSEAKYRFVLDVAGAFKEDLMDDDKLDTITDSTDSTD